MAEPKIRGHQATGAAPWPLILLEGESGSGRSWRAALLSADPRIGEVYWLDLAEGTGDQYGAIPGTSYTVIDHDGTYADVLDQVEAVKARAAQVREAGKPPVVLVIDTISDVWVGLSDWAGQLARKSQNNQKILAADPNADVDVGHTYWNKATARWKRLMLRLMTFPGVVVLIANGDEVTEFDAAGRPTRSKVWSVEGQKKLTRDVMVWIRLFRDGPPQIVKARTVHGGIRPGQDAPRKVQDRDDLLAWIVFDVLRCDPGTATTRNVQHVTGGELTAEERAEDAGPEAAEPQPDGTDPAWLAGVQQDIAASQELAHLVPFWPQILAAVQEGRCTRADQARLKMAIGNRRAELEAPTGRESAA